MQMASWSAEIWHQVTRDACTPDDRVTGFSLSLTSRSLHEVTGTKGFHLQSLCLQNNARIAEYADLISPLPFPAAAQATIGGVAQTKRAAATTGTHPHADIAPSVCDTSPVQSSRKLLPSGFPHRFSYIRHLFIQNPATSLMGRLQPRLSGSAASDDDAVLAFLRGGRETGEYSSLVRIFSAFSSMTGCKLRTYFALLETGFGRWSTTTPRSLRFPAIPVPFLQHLVELAMTWEQYVSETVDLPSLRRLTLLWLRGTDSFGDGDLEVVRTKAPNLTHLRITPILLNSAKFLPRLIDVLAYHIFQTASDVARSLLPATLQRVLLEVKSPNPLMMRLLQVSPHCLHSRCSD